MQSDAFHFLHLQIFISQPGTSSETAQWGFARMCDCNCFLMSSLFSLIEDHILLQPMVYTHKHQQNVTTTVD